MTQSQRYQIIPHTADIGLKTSAASLEEAFGNIAYGMFSLITDIRKVRRQIAFTTTLHASDREALLVTWLNELLFRFDTEQLITAEYFFEEMSGTSLKAVCLADKVDRKRHRIFRGVKSATYHMLKVELTKTKLWKIQVILDL